MTTAIKDKTDIFETVTGKLIDLIEKNEAGDWTKPWTSVLAGAGLSQNPVTGKGYRGMNELLLMAVTASEGYTANVWATYKQWAAKEAQVRKGEHGTKLIKWGRSSKCSTCAKPAKPTCSDNGHKVNTRMWAAPFTVFNADQVDGYEVVPPKAIADLGKAPEKVKEIEDFITNTGAVIRHKPQDSAFYSHVTDDITIPHECQFDTTTGYYSTKLHELTHWTGHTDRMNREAKNVFGSSKYAAEELVAELGATFLSAQFGIESEPHAEHAAYLASWLRGLKDDPRAMYRAAKYAQAAVNHLNDLQSEEATA